jgi:hypothetical protein
MPRISRVRTEKLTSFECALPRQAPHDQNRRAVGIAARRKHRSAAPPSIPNEARDDGTRVAEV